MDLLNLIKIENKYYTSQEFSINIYFDIIQMKYLL